MPWLLLCPQEEAGANRSAAAGFPNLSVIDVGAPAGLTVNASNPSELSQEKDQAVSNGPEKGTFTHAELLEDPASE